MRKLPLLLTIVVGVALWAAPSQAQNISFYPVYVEDSNAVPEGMSALRNAYKLCPPHAEYCTGVSQAYHHVRPWTAHIFVPADSVYATNVLDVTNCASVRVRVKEMDTDGSGDETATAELFVQAVLDADGNGNTCTNAETVGQTYILADVNGDGSIDAADSVTMDGDDGTDSDGDGTARQTGAMYDITGESLIRLCIMQTGGDLVDVATDNSYADVTCR